MPNDEMENRPDDRPAELEDTSQNQPDDSTTSRLDQGTTVTATVPLEHHA